MEKIWLCRKHGRYSEIAVIWIVHIILAFQLVAISAVFSEVVSPKICDEVAICLVVDINSGKILFQKRAHEKLYPASCTKIATLAYILSTPQLDLSKKLVVPQEAIRVVRDVEKARDNFSKYPSYVQEATGTSVFLKEGEIITVQDAIHGMMLRSANDAANVLAYYWGGKSIEKCMANINAFTASLGCTATHFMNPHGLHHPEHYSSAYDLALISMYGMKHLPLFRHIVSLQSYEKPKTNKQPAVVWYQANRLLRPGHFFCQYATGIKTGRHVRALENIVVSGEKEGRSIIVVVMQCSNRSKLYIVSKQILEYYLNEAKIEKKVISPGRIVLTKEILGQQPLPLYVSEGYSYYTYRSEEPKITSRVDWKAHHFPIQKDECVGTLTIEMDGKSVKKINIYSLQARFRTIKSTLYQVVDLLENGIPYLKNHSFRVAIVGIIFLAVMVGAIRCKKKKKR